MGGDVRCRFGEWVFRGGPGTILCLCMRREGRGLVITDKVNFWAGVCVLCRGGRRLVTTDMKNIFVRM